MAAAAPIASLIIAGVKLGIAVVVIMISLFAVSGYRSLATFYRFKWWSFTMLVFVALIAYIIFLLYTGKIKECFQDSCIYVLVTLIIVGVGSLIWSWIMQRSSDKRVARYQLYNTTRSLLR